MDPLKAVATGDFHQWILDNTDMVELRKTMIAPRRRQSVGSKNCPGSAVLAWLLVNLPHHLLHHLHHLI